MATRLKFIGVMHQHKLIPQLLFCFDMRRIFQNSIGDRAHLLAGWRVVMAYAFRTLVAVNLVNAITPSKSPHSGIPGSHISQLIQRLVISKRHFNELPLNHFKISKLKSFSITLYYLLTVC